MPRCLEQREQFPDAMLATATHDHKRGEDVSARLAVLSEMPDAMGRERSPLADAECVAPACGRLVQCRRPATRRCSIR